MKLVGVIAALLVGGCMKHSEKYCAMHPEDTDNCSGTDAGMMCVDNAECATADPSTPTCTTDGRCVECTLEDSSACGSRRLACIEEVCAPCESHHDCTSDVCLADGTCADASLVAYLAPNGGGDTCTAAAPCNELVDAVNTQRHIFKIDGGPIVDNGVAVFDTGSTEIYGEQGASVTRDTPGNIVEFSGAGTELAIYDVRLFGATGTGLGNAIYTSSPNNPKLTLDRVLIDGNDGSGVRALDGGDITITRSVIANNFGNQGVFIQNGTFSITNTVIAQNGKTTIVTGGAYLMPAGPSRFEFNTVVDNVSMGGPGAYRGISCSIGLDLANSILTGNKTSGCDVTYSLFTLNDMVVGTGNMVGDPMFRSIANPAGPTYYRLGQNSPAKDTADAAATLMMDIDGNARPVDGRSDMGADEVTP